MNAKRIIKVCGMRDSENIREVERLGVDWLGFIFAPKSPRYVSERPAYLPTKAKRVGVFVDAPIDEVVKTAREYALDIIQLHGKETPEYMDRLRPLCGNHVEALIKAFNIATVEDLKQTRAYEGHADYFLFDTRCPRPLVSPSRPLSSASRPLVSPSRPLCCDHVAAPSTAPPGGTGEKFDWTILDTYDGSVPFLLSGGIGPDDAEKVNAFHHPLLAGIDLNSRFEAAPALKDTTLLKNFIETIVTIGTIATIETIKTTKPTPTMNKDNKINKLFQENKDKKLLSLYFCAGCPTLDGTGEVIKTMERRGISMIEVGIPFSDPMADGPVIQDAATTALKNGMTLQKLFAQLKDIKDEVSIPLVLMGYLNPIMQYGIEAFCQSCVDSGVSGVIIPDLPFKDYQESVKPIADKYDIRVIMLITPETSEERIRFIDEHTDGFIYMVSSAAITGAQKSFDEAKQEYFRRINAMQLRNPRMIGFGISNAQTLKAAQDNAAGAIIGSKFVTLLSESKDADEALDKLFEALK